MGSQETLHPKSGHTKGSTETWYATLVEGDKLLLCIPVILTLVFAAAAAYSSFYTNFTPPPLVYDRLEITSGDVVCPGDTMQMVVEGRILRAPETVLVVRNIFSIATKHNVVADMEPAWRALWEPGQFTNPRLTYTLPSDIQPGEYEFRLSAQTMHGRMAKASVPFTVDDCEMTNAR